MRKKEGQISNQLQELGGRMEGWRNSHTPRRRLPEELWQAAVEVARQEGIYQTARALRLDYANLKRRIEMTGGKEAIAPPTTQQAGPSVKRRRKVPGSVKRVTEPATFVELVAGAIGSDCLIEVEGRGGRMRIQMKLTAPEVMNLVRDWRERQV
jgi:hypothetical protein